QDAPARRARGAGRARARGGGRRGRRRRHDRVPRHERGRPRHAARRRPARRLPPPRGRTPALRLALPRSVRPPVRRPAPAPAHGFLTSSAPSTLSTLTLPSGETVIVWRVWFQPRCALVQPTVTSVPSGWRSVDGLAISALTSGGRVLPSGPRE